MTPDATLLLPRSNPSPGGSARLWILHIPLGLTSAVGTLMSHGMYFVTERVLGWGKLENLVLSASLGGVYVCGALISSKASARLGKRSLLLSLYALLGLLAAALAFATHPWIFVPLAALWTFLVAANWPALEALMCHGATTAQTSSRTGLFNINWALTGAIAIAIASTVVSKSVQGLFFAAAFLHLVSFLGVFLYHPPASTPHADLKPEPALLAQQSLARKLARIALPATYTIQYSLTPLLASLDAVKALDPAWHSPVVCVWLVGRFLAFVLMMSTHRWHTRPRWLVAALLIVAAAFLAATLPPGRLALSSQLIWIIAAEAILGLATGFVYYCSLYFGMVLSHDGDAAGGSTQQGSYHEALIGAGIILGPGLGAVAHTMGRSPVMGVSVIVALCLGACLKVTLSDAAKRRAVSGPPARQP